MRQFIWICHIPQRRTRKTSQAGLNVFSKVSQWFHINSVPALSCSHVRLSHAFSLPFDPPFINRQYVNSSRGEQVVSAVWSAHTGCNRRSGSAASIQLNNQIARRLCLRLIRLSKSSVQAVCVWLWRLGIVFIMTMFWLQTATEIVSNTWANCLFLLVEWPLSNQ